MNAETAAMLRSTLTRLLAESGGREFVRRLAELGWSDVTADDPRAAAGLLFEAQGRAGVSTAALDLVVLATLGVGDRCDAVLHPYPRPGTEAAGRLDATGPLQIDGVALAPLDPTAAVAVPVTVDGAAGCVLLEPSVVAGLDAEPLDGLAPELGLVRVRGPVDPAEAGALRPASNAAAVGVARRALAHELTGLTAAMIGLAVEHATDRVQFGRPIGAFQAVQHRLADCHVALEAARAAATQADESGDELAAAAAKALAGVAFRAAAANCQQVLGAVGFTWEHPFHFFLRRGAVLELLYGSTPWLRRHLGRTLRSGHQPFRTSVSL